ncbi:MAG: hypothetical protein KGY75_09950 [Candidatus Cloacimonetes bacterium]|nr:hypothetical protein [Candidatus Cloacimonadota bacterium]MBS3768424.1 hypothetical protein [Candidatus Cloacimonadota bacterium]
MEEKEAKVFHFKDIFKAWNHSFRFHRLLISGFALILSFIVFLLLFRPFIFDLVNLNVSRFNPQKLLSFRNILAIILSGFIFFIAKMSIAFSIRREVVDDEIFVGWKEVGKFLVKHLKTFLFYILGWILVFVLIALGQLFFYAIGAIPYVGSLWLSITYLIPFAISLFFVLSAVVLLFADTFGAVIIGVERDSAMDSIISLYHLVKDHGVYIVVTSFLSWFVGFIAFMFVNMVTKFALQFTTWGAELIMGGEFTKITIPKFFSFLKLIHPCLNATNSLNGGYYTIPGFIIGVFIILITSVAIAYFFTYMSGAQTFIYLSSQEKFYPEQDTEEFQETEFEEEEGEESEKEETELEEE